MVENELLKELCKSLEKTNCAIKNGQNLIRQNELFTELDRKLTLLAEIILEYKIDNYKEVSNLIWKEIKLEG